MAVQLGAMTLPFRAHPYERALDAIAEAGIRYVCIGTPHDGRWTPHPDDNEETVAKRVEACRSRGLQPIMQFCLAFAHQEGAEAMWSNVVRQAAAHGIPHLLGMGTFGYNAHFAGRRPLRQQAEDEERWVDVTRRICDLALPHNITVQIKPHTGNTATSVECRQTLVEVSRPNFKICYDCGNVRYYEGVDPVLDLPLIVDEVKGLCLKDHQGPRLNNNFPPPGEGEIDHATIFRMLKKANFSGPLIIERVDGTDDATKMPLDEIARRLARSKGLMEAAIREAGLELA